MFFSGRSVSAALKVSLFKAKEKKGKARERKERKGKSSFVISRSPFRKGKENSRRNVE